VDVAFTPQVNEFRGDRSAQLNILDIRPSCKAACLPDTFGYSGLRQGVVDPANAHRLLPDRTTLALVWRYLASVDRPVREDPMCLCRKIVRWSGTALSLGQLLTCLDIFRDVSLLRLQRQHKYITVELIPGDKKADLNESRTMRLLLQAKES